MAAVSHEGDFVIDPAAGRKNYLFVGSQAGGKVGQSDRTLAQLDLALARRDRAPTLTDALDNDTREPLISRGKVHDGCNHQRGGPGVEHRVPLDSEHRFPTSAPGNVRQRRRGRIR